MKFGVTFSEPYALALGLDPPVVYSSLLRDLGLSTIRLCTYWDRTEPRPGEFDFHGSNRQVEEGAKASVEMIMTVGVKAPRWPEFHRPAWLAANDSLYEYRLLRMIESVVRHFADLPISIWQVENEPYVSFGGPRLAEDLLRREIELVRSLDVRPIMLTDSADKGNWVRAARWGDILGVNLYTRTWNGRRYVDIDVPPARYASKIRSVSSTVARVIVTELQAEPWGPAPVTELAPGEASITMNPEQLRRNVEIAESAGFETILFWGGEWWYWLREHGDPSMWETATAIIEERGRELAS